MRRAELLRYRGSLDWFAKRTRGGGPPPLEGGLSARPHEPPVGRSSALTRSVSEYPHTLTDMCSTAPILLLMLLAKGVWCLRLVSLHVPTRVIVGDTIKLSCGYDLEGDPLYSIKWYRDDVEFFRFVPRDKPPGQFFPLQGVIVDLIRSANGTVYMKDTDETTTGTYKCEVSADAPSFQTVSAHKKLVVREFDLDGAGHLRSGVSLLLATSLLLAFLW